MILDRTRVMSLVALLCLGSSALSAKETSIDVFFERFTADWVRSDPDLATATRYFSGEEQALLERQLSPETRAFTLERIARARRGLAELDKFDLEELSDSQRVSVQLMRWQLETIVRSEAFLDHRFPLNQHSGANIQLVESLSLRHPLNTPQDADNYIVRMGFIARRMDETIVEARRRIDKGMPPPRFIMQRTIEQMKAFHDMPAEQNPLVTAYAQKIADIEELQDAKRTGLQQRAARIVADEVYPAWQRAITFLERALPRTSDDAGLWRFEDGGDAYAYALHRFTTTDLTADRIHEIGLREVARIEAEMDAILRQLGRKDGSVRERVMKLRQDLSYPNPTSEESRAALMSDIEHYMEDAFRRSQSLFDLQPQAPVIARPFPRFREATASANYNRAPLDASRPALFQMPLRPQRMTKFALRTLVYHETIPGHHFQIAIEQENEALPRFRQARALGGISALSEGWALYAEKLAAEAGWYDGDPEGLLGHLDAQLFRARRLVVDTGLHAKRWTRQQAIDYGFEPSEVERYVVNPGQACAYMIGQLRILELRDRARAALGDRFSPQQFHNAVLRTGTVPLALLEQEVERYLAEAR